MFSMPFYDIEAPLGIKYGALGFQALLGYIVGFFTMPQLSQPAQLEKLMKSEIACLLRATGEGRDISYMLILSSMALRSLWEAFEKSVATNKSDATSPEKEVTVFSSLSESKLFFVYWCYITCRGHEDSGVAQEYCNDVLKTVQAFAKTFDCQMETDMVIKGYCPLV